MYNDSELVAAQSCEEDALIEGPELEPVQQIAEIYKGIIRNIIKIRGPLQPGEVNRYGYRVEYTEKGDKVVWIPDDEHPGEEWSLLLRRNDNDILAAERELFEKAWWHRYQQRHQMIKNGEVTLAENQKLVLEEDKKDARRIERKFGKKNLLCDDFEFGLLMGRFSALSWVTGAEWERSMDI
jgi:hypothetical protein